MKINACNYSAFILTSMNCHTSGTLLQFILLHYVMPHPNYINVHIAVLRVLQKRLSRHWKVLHMVLAMTQNQMDQKALMNLNTSSWIPFIPFPPLERIKSHHTQLKVMLHTLTKVSTKRSHTRAMLGLIGHSLVCPLI